MATTTPGYTGSNVGKIIGGIILLSLIAGWMLFGGCEGHQSKPTSVQGGKVITVPVFTDRWTGVPTDGRYFENHDIIHNGVTLSFYISVNNVDNPKELPSPSGRIFLGPQSDIKKVYFKLKPNQGYDKATLQMDLY
jgi:hypothetical protein